MDLRQGNGWSGSMEVLPFIVTPTLVRPGRENGVLRIGCLNERDCNEVEKRGELGSMFEECKLDILGLSERVLRGRES